MPKKKQTNPKTPAGFIKAEIATTNMCLFITVQLKVKKADVLLICKDCIMLETSSD